MSLVELSLDDIIAQKRKGNKDGGRGGSRQGNRGRNGGPNFKARGNNRFAERSGQRHGPIIGGSNPNSMVRINLSNLAASVSSADLEELFGSYHIETATVHFNEHGESCGTGDIYLRKKDALTVLRDFKGVALDGQILNMLLVDGSSIRDRVGVIDRTRPRIFKRNDQHQRGGGQPKRGRGGNRRDAKPEKSVEDLDAELDAYMTRAKN